MVPNLKMTYDNAIDQKTKAEESNKASSWIAEQNRLVEESVVINKVDSTVAAKEKGLQNNQQRRGKERPPFLFVGGTHLSLERFTLGATVPDRKSVV